MTKSKVTFKEWFTEVNIIDNLQDVDLSGKSETDWLKLYGAGLTPAGAFTEMVQKRVGEVYTECVNETFGDLLHEHNDKGITG